MNKKERAAFYHGCGYNCAQSVACAFADDFSLDRAALLRLAEGFGAGCGCGRGTCGALSGAILLCGCKNADGDLDAPRSKPKTYAVAAAMTKAFEEKCGALVCEDIKGKKTGTPTVSCAACIDCGVELVERFLLP